MILYGAVKDRSSRIVLPSFKAAQALMRLNRGEYTADAIVVIGAIALSVYYLGSIMPAVAIIAGLIVGLIIGIITEVYTSGDYGSVKKIAEQSETVVLVLILQVMLL